MTDAVRYSDAILVRLTPEMKAAISETARQRGAKSVEWVRAALEKALRADGVYTLPDRQFALVANGELIRSTFGDGSRVITTYWPSPTEQGEWMPIEDEAPFDPRPGVYPAYRLGGDRVLRFWPTAERA